MKQILISIKPEWCEKIFNGEKTIEVRKSAPKLEPPFKVFVYMTKSKDKLTQFYNDYGEPTNGKVIGSFICDKITRYESEFWDDDTYERIQEPWEPLDFAEYGEYEYDTIGVNGEFCGKGIELSKQSCLSWKELRNYVGQGIRNFYGWHITEPKLFDKPRALSTFRKPCGHSISCGRCGYSEMIWDNNYEQFDYVCKRPSLTRPPQSWCYIEEDEENGTH